MSKAEDLTKELYPDWEITGVSNVDGQEESMVRIQRVAYIEGYHQAEKDLELGWEDINRIKIIIKDVYRDYPHGIDAKQFGIEVLNRFNRQKGKQYESS